MKSNDLNALWAMRVIDRQLEDSLMNIIEMPEFHRWLSRSVCKDLNAKQIGQSLQRASLNISYLEGHEYINELDETRHATAPARPRQSPTADAKNRPQGNPPAKSRGTSRTAQKNASTKNKKTRTKKMETSEMFEAGLFDTGDIMTIKDRDGSEARVVDGKNVIYQNEKMTFNRWGKLVLGGERSIYLYATLPDGRTLDEARSKM